MISKKDTHHISYKFDSPPDKGGILQIEFTDKKPDRFVEKSDEEAKLLVSVGDKKKFNLRKLFILARKVIVLSKHYRYKKIILSLKDFKFGNVKISDEKLAELLGINFNMANYEFVSFKSEPEDGWFFIEEIFVGDAKSSSVQKAFRAGGIIGEEVNMCRTLANTPGGNMTPSILANTAKQLAREAKVRVKVLDKDDMKILGMGGVLGVAQGSSENPKFIVLEYYGENKKEKPIVIIGKGVTFDTGGLSLKPSEHMTDMHYDMSGGAAAIHAVITASRLGIKKNLVALIPAVENMPSGTSYRPGDVLRTMSGKTIEVLNTDAEGRIILADALTYAEKYNPELVIDIATLTGSAVAALGQRAAAIFTKDEKLQTKCIKAGESSGDYVWPLPLWEEYEEDIKGTFGDWANIAKTKYGGAITAAVFLYQFAKKYPWLHIDIAPTMSSIEGQFLAKGATGSPIRMLINLLRDH